MELFEKYENWLWKLRTRRNTRGNRLFLMKWAPFVETLQPWQKTIFLEQVEQNTRINNRREAFMLVAIFLMGVFVGAFYGPGVFLLFT